MNDDMNFNPISKDGSQENDTTDRKEYDSGSGKHPYEENDAGRSEPDAYEIDYAAQPEKETDGVNDAVPSEKETDGVNDAVPSEKETDGINDAVQPEKETDGIDDAVRPEKETDDVNDENQPENEPYDRYYSNQNNEEVQSSREPQNDSGNIYYFHQENEQRDENKNGSSHLKMGGVVALGIVTALVIGSLIYSFQGNNRIVWPTAEEENSAANRLVLGNSQSENEVTQEKQLQSQSTAPKGSLDVSDVVAATMPGIVSITSESVQEVEYFFYGTYEIPSESAGSGIIIAQSDTELLIATNYHVVDGADSLTVCFSTEDTEDAIVSANVKGTDAEQDLAVIAVKLNDISDEVLSQIRIVSLGDSDSLQVGQRAIAIGNALGYGQSVTAGIVSALNRSLTIDNVESTFIQTDAAINFGNSGGALLNASGEVIGINSAKATSSGVEGMGYAIPINAAKPILEDLINKVTREKVDASEKGSLGIDAKSVSQEAQQVYNIPAGAFVYKVEPGAAADEAGIIQGDIIIKMDGTRINSADALENLLNYYKEGETVEVVYETGGSGSYREKTVSVTLQAAASENNSDPYPYQMPGYGNGGFGGGF
ncbi:MAG: trypsin-like peptidase domain-containing protein [Lachnospiraceae bacterium]|nr:trypsin-like peptidase domain-containing protein [Lachnospiraceae bacterium]